MTAVKMAVKAMVKGLFKWLIWIMTSLLFFLSLWIILPAPNLFFLRLAVVAPEVSPFLCLLSAVMLMLALFPGSYWLRGAHNRWLFLSLILLLTLSTLLYSKPLQQQSAAIAQAEQSMATAFLVEQTHLPTLSQTLPLPKFSYRRFFRGDLLSSNLVSSNLASSNLASSNLASSNLASSNLASSNLTSSVPSSVRSTAPILFAAPDNQPLYLTFYQPSSLYSKASDEASKYPTVVIIYGGSWQRGSSSDNVQMGQYLARRGYVVAAIDYRHAPEHTFPDQLEDVQSALTFITENAAQFKVDSDRIALLGWSAGAHLAMLSAFQSATSQPAISQPTLRSVVSYYGPIDLTTGYAEPPAPDPIDVRQVLRDFIGGSPAEKPSAYAQASPISFIQAQQLPPTLLIYGGRDHIVEARFGQSLYDQLIANGHTAVWVKIPWAEHAFDKIFHGLSNQMALHYLERFLYQTLQVNV